MSISNKSPTEFDLLQVYVEEMEAQGIKHNLVRLDINESLAERIGIEMGSEVTLEQLQVTTDRCLANNWLEHTCLGNKYQMLSLTSTGFGVVRSRQRKEESLANRSFLKKISDYIEDHKGLFIALGAIIAIVGLLIKLFMR